LNISGTTITGLTQSSISALATLISEGATLVVQNNANFNWDDVSIDGTLSLTSGKTLLINGSNSVDELIIASGADVTLADAATLELSTLSVTSDAINEVTIQSLGNAIIHMPVHQRLCFDFMEISNVDLTGSTIISVGHNSILSNADNWQETSCDETVFAHFDVSFMCANSLTTFTDQSSGNLISWNWTFGDETSGNNSATTQNASHIFEAPAKYSVTLSVSDGLSTNSFTKEITIKNNNLTANSIVLNSGSLMSFHQAASYQWYKDSELIDGAVSRSYAFDGVDGTYAVVINNGGTCNIISSYVITGVEEAVRGIKIFPVPAKDVINVHKPDATQAKVILYNSVGQAIMQVDFNKKDLSIDVKHLPDGLYHLEIKSPSYTHQRKITIDRN
jgi:PKD repeat protein